MGRWARATAGHLASAASLLAHGWAAFSVATALAGLGVLGLVALGLAAAAWLPAWLRHALIGASILLRAGAALYQAGQAKGAHEAFAVEAARELQRDRDRAAAAAAVSASDRARAEAAEASARAADVRMRELRRSLARPPDAACATADDVRQSRGL